MILTRRTKPLKRRSIEVAGLMVSCLVAVGFAATGRVFAQAGAPALQIDRPVAHAIVREVIPVKINPRDIPADGYVSVSVDGNFLKGAVLPSDAARTDTVFYWDTKAPYKSIDDPGTQNYIQDGNHTLSVSLYAGGKLIGIGTVPVTVQNQIKFSDQGINLSYKWRVDQSLMYHRTTDLTVPAQDNPATIQSGSVQSSSITYDRTVEDVTDNQALLRDRLDPSGYTVAGGQPQLVSAQYNVKSSYRTYNQYGELLSEMAPLSQGDHFAFGVAVLPGRRVAQGDSWEVPIPVSLDWSGMDPLNVTGEARLDSFEWQDGYPTAKIHETFNGSAKLPTSAKGMFAGTNLEQLNIDRVIYIAYNSGRLIKMRTTMDIVADLTSSQVSTLTAPPAPAAAPAPDASDAGGGDAAAGGGGGAAFRQGAPPWMANGGAPPWASRGGGPPPWVTNPGMAPPSGPPAAASPFGGGAPEVVAETTPIHLTYTEGTEIVLGQ